MTTAAEPREVEKHRGEDYNQKEEPEPEG